MTVTGPPAAIWLRNFGMTLPVEPSTLPKRTATKRVRPPPSPWQSSSASRLLAPMTLVGFTALSVEMSTNFSTPWRIAACAAHHVPSALFRTASQALSSSINGTCL